MLIDRYSTDLTYDFSFFWTLYCYVFLDYQVFWGEREEGNADQLMQTVRCLSFMRYKFSQYSILCLRSGKDITVGDMNVLRFSVYVFLVPVVMTERAILSSIAFPSRRSYTSKRDSSNYLESGRTAWDKEFCLFFPLRNREPKPREERVMVLEGVLNLFWTFCNT